MKDMSSLVGAFSGMLFNGWQFWLDGCEAPTVRGDSHFVPPEAGSQASGETAYPQVTV